MGAVFQQPEKIEIFYRKTIVHKLVICYDMYGAIIMAGGYVLHSNPVKTGEI